MARASALLLLLAHLAACPKPGVQGAYDEAAPLLAELSSRASTAQRVEGQGRLSLPGPEGAAGGVELLLLAQVPASARIEALSFFGDPLAVVVIHEGQLAVDDLYRGQRWRGPLDAPEAQALLPIPLPPTALPELLLGRVPLRDEGPRALSHDAAGRRYLLTLGEGAGAQRLEIDGDTLDPIALVWLDRAGEPTLRLVFEAWRHSAQGRYAERWRIEVPGRGAYGFSWSERSAVGAPIPEDEAFSLGE